MFDDIQRKEKNCICFPLDFAKIDGCTNVKVNICQGDSQINTDRFLVEFKGKSVSRENEEFTGKLKSIYSFCPAWHLQTMSWASSHLLRCSYS